MIRRLDSLFLRLFVLMWVVLVVSHLVAFNWVVPVMEHEDASLAGRLTRGPAMPSLPPIGLLTGPGAPGAGPLGGGPSPDGRSLGPVEGAPPWPPAFAPDGPGGPIGPGGPVGPGGPGPLGQSLWWDYALRVLLIGLGAWLGARWLAAPMQRLARAAQALPQGLEQGRQPAALDERHGTVEVRETARVFNQMAQRLQRQFDQRSLHMAAVSHDLRTPLTRLRLRLERLTDPAALAAIADLREMDELIESSLAVMREQAGDTASAEVDLRALLQSLVDDLAEQGQAVAMDEDAPPARVRAHTASLRRIVGNLVGNALRYGQCAQVAMAVQAGQVVVTVDDNGLGIPPERLEQVFEPWVRLEAGVQRPGGNGLGLAIARDLALREGGTLSLANRPEGGLRATLTLPLA